MSHALPRAPLAEADYLDGEALADHKHEYVAGQAFAMAGASERHNRIAVNLAFHLRAATRGKPCGAFVSDMKLRLPVGPTYYYPDAMLVCDPADDHPQYKTAPCFLAEVLSPGTAALDLREKSVAYRALGSLNAFLLVDSERVWAQWWFRDAAGQWFEQTLDAADRVAVPCPGVTLALSLDDLYEDTGLLVV